jgi:hypothetical protein
VAAEGIGSAELVISLDTREEEAEAASEGEGSRVEEGAVDEEMAMEVDEETTSESEASVEEVTIEDVERASDEIEVQLDAIEEDGIDSWALLVVEVVDEVALVLGDGESGSADEDSAVGGIVDETSLVVPILELPEARADETPLALAPPCASSTSSPNNTMQNR